MSVVIMYVSYLSGILKNGLNSIFLLSSDEMLSDICMYVNFFLIFHKEAHSKLGFYGYDLQDSVGASNSLSIRSDEGLIHELRDPNYPNYAMNVGHQPEYAGIAQAPHAARGGCIFYKSFN